MDYETYTFGHMADQEPQESLGLEFTVRLESKTADIKLDTAQKISAEHIIFATFGHAATFLTAKAPTDAKPVVAVISTEKKESLAEVYDIGEKNFFVIFQYPVAGIGYMEFAKTFFSYFEPKNVVILDSMPLMRYTAEPVGRESRKPFLRYVANKRATVDTKIPKVEVGRMFHGVVADIFSYSEMNGLPVVMFLVVFTEYQIIFDEVKALDEVAESFKFLGKKLEQKEVNAIISKTNKKTYSSNLYI